MDHLVGHTFCCQCHALLAFWSRHASSWTNIWWHLVPFLAVKPKFLSQGSICATHFVKKVDLSFSTHVSSVTTSITIWHIEQFRRMAACAFQSPCGFWSRHAHTEGPKAHAILQHTLIMYKNIVGLQVATILIPLFSSGTLRCNFYGGHWDASWQLYFGLSNYDHEHVHNHEIVLHYFGPWEEFGKAALTSGSGHG